jgi:hypothetical protein
MGIESAAAAIDFAGLVDEAVRNKDGERSSTPRRRSSVASMSMKLLLANAAIHLRAVDSKARFSASLLYLKAANCDGFLESRARQVQGLDIPNEAFRRCFS